MDLILKEAESRILESTLNVKDVITNPGGNLLAQTNEKNFVYRIIFNLCFDLSENHSLRTSFQVHKKLIGPVIRPLFR